LAFFFTPICAPDLPNKNKLKFLLTNHYLKVLKHVDRTILGLPGSVSLIINGWASKNDKGYIAVFVSYLHRDGPPSKINQILLRIIQTTSHSADYFFDSLIQHIFSKDGFGPLSPGAGIYPEKIIEIVCDNASNNTALVGKLNKWIATQQDQSIIPHKIYLIYCFAQSIHRVVLILLAYVDSEIEEV
jgi:hypothetical protein